MKKDSQKGFTLIELLVVISIIGLLSSVVLASLNSSRIRARDAKRIQDVKQLKNAIEMYYDNYGYYPSVGNDGWGYDISSLNGVLVPTYIKSIATDPTGDSRQYVRGAPSQNSYGIYVYQERTGTYCHSG